MALTSASTNRVVAGRRVGMCGLVFHKKMKIKERERERERKDDLSVKVRLISRMCVLQYKLCDVEATGNCSIDINGIISYALYFGARVSDLVLLEQESRCRETINLTLESE